jgi:hypothetical protein
MKKCIIRILVIGAVVAIVAPINATYFHGDDYFPIGLTGLGYTGYDIPYGEENWQFERDLIEDLGINCVGCEDAWQNALIDFAQKGYETYLTEVCMELTENDTPTVYLITASYGAAPKRLDKNIIFKYTEANL